MSSSELQGEIQLKQTSEYVFCSLGIDTRLTSVKSQVEGIWM